MWGHCKKFKIAENYKEQLLEIFNRLRFIRINQNWFNITPTEPWSTNTLVTFSNDGRSNIRSNKVLSKIERRPRAPVFCVRAF